MLLPPNRPRRPRQRFGPPSIIRLVLFLVVTCWAIWYLLQLSARVAQQQP
ncbi:MAG TPA: hypothetical protein VFQ45_00080 [Longimicrobium sp.]|nr:hypothetical protein [Longimicrobium sp.]